MRFNALNNVAYFFATEAVRISEDYESIFIVHCFCINFSFLKNCQCSFQPIDVHLFLHIYVIGISTCIFMSLVFLLKKSLRQCRVRYSKYLVTLRVKNVLIFSFVFDQQYMLCSYLSKIQERFIKQMLLKQQRLNCCLQSDRQSH